MAKALGAKTAMADQENLLASICEQLRPLEDEKPVDILTFIEDPRYLGMKTPYPWLKWVLSMFYYPKEHFDECHFTWRGRECTFPGFKSLGYSRSDVEMMRFNEMVLIIGQRTGKSWLAAIMILYEFYKLLCVDDISIEYPGLAPRTPIYLSVGATALKQAEGTVWHYVEEGFEGSPWFREYAKKASLLEMPDGKHMAFTSKDREFHFWHKNIHLDCVHSRSGGLRGFTRKMICADEICHHQEGDKKSGEQMYEALSASTMNFKINGFKLAISSPNNIADIGMKLLAQCGVKFSWEGYDQLGFSYMTEFDGREVGDPNPNMLGFHFPTWELNPEVLFEDFAYDLRSKPEYTWRNFGALPPATDEPFFSDLNVIKDIFDPNRSCPVNDSGQLTGAISPDYRVSGYHLHVDVGAGKPSNFGIALGHPVVEISRDGTRHTKVVIDLAYAVKAQSNGEMNYRAARELIDAIIQKFPIACYSSDGWNDLEYRERIRNRVGRVETLVVQKEHYDELKTAAYERAVSCHYYPLVEEELKRLGLKNGEKVVKGTGFTKDVADCICAVTYRSMSRAVKHPVNGFATTGLLSR